MVYKNSRGQVLMELVLTLILFTSLLFALQKMSVKYSESTNKYKLSKKSRSL